MTITVYPLSGAANAAARYTAAAQTDVRLGNPNEGNFVAWTTTTSDTAPVPPADQWNRLRPSEGVAMTLLAGERLWLASPGGLPALASIEV